MWSTWSRRASLGNPARDQPRLNGGPGRPLVSPRRSWQRDRANPPRDFVLQNSTVCIIDAGDQARFLVNTGAENLVYPFRYHDGTWQQIGFAGTGHLSLLASVRSTMPRTSRPRFRVDGQMRPVPAVSCRLRCSCFAGLCRKRPDHRRIDEHERANPGPIVIGQSGQRLVKLVPAQPCTNNCIQVTSIQMQGKGPRLLRSGVRPK